MLISSIQIKLITWSATKQYYYEYFRNLNQCIYNKKTPSMQGKRAEDLVVFNWGRPYAMVQPITVAMKKINMAKSHFNLLQ